MLHTALTRMAMAIALLLPTVSLAQENTWLQSAPAMLIFFLPATAALMMIGMGLFKSGFLAGRSPAWLYGLFILPESLPPERRVHRFDWSKANPIGALRLLRSAPGLPSLAGVAFLFQLAHMVLPAIFVLYTGHRYGWSTGTIGLTMMLTGVLGVIVQSMLIGPVVRRIGERRAVLLGAAAGAVGFAIYGWAPNGWLYLSAAPIFAFINFLMPGLQALMTRRLGPSQQGQLQGANASMAGVAAILGPLIFGEAFAWSLRQEGWNAPGLAIYLASAMMVLAFALALRSAKVPEPEPQPA